MTGGEVVEAGEELFVHFDWLDLDERVGILVYLRITKAGQNRIDTACYLFSWLMAHGTWYMVPLSPLRLERDSII